MPDFIALENQKQLQQQLQALLEGLGQSKDCPELLQLLIDLQLKNRLILRKGVYILRDDLENIKVTSCQTKIYQGEIGKRLKTIKIDQLSNIMIYANNALKNTVLPLNLNFAMTLDDVMRNLGIYHQTVSQHIADDSQSYTWILDNVQVKLSFMTSSRHPQPKLYAIEYVYLKTDQTTTDATSPVLEVGDDG
ncbi:MULTISPECIES: hypothetical protein [unclassified Acinetobacter]|uniref:hypothetical protein n=1 Tax=unclassified Acinetobacter TaxID=196816 RepID=UPI0035BA761C